MFGEELWWPADDMLDHPHSIFHNLEYSVVRIYRISNRLLELLLNNELATQTHMLGLVEMILVLFQHSERESPSNMNLLNLISCSQTSSWRLFSMLTIFKLHCEVDPEATRRPRPVSLSAFIHTLERAPLLICPPPWDGFQISAWQTPSLPRRPAAETGSASPSCRSRPSERVGRVDTSTRSSSGRRHRGAAPRPPQPRGRPGQSSSPSRSPAARSSLGTPCPGHCREDEDVKEVGGQNSHSAHWKVFKLKIPTHNWKASLNFADQLLFLDLVVNLRFLSARKGPTMQTSTKGRNIPDVCHFMSFTAATGWSKYGCYCCQHFYSLIIHLVS